MAIFADDAGRIPAPSGTSMPPDLAALIASSMAGTQSGGGSGSPTGIPLLIPLRKGPATKEVRTEGVGWRTMDTGNAQAFTTLDEAVNSFYLMDDDYREDLMKKMWYYGLLDGPNNVAKAQGVWAAAVEQSWNFKQAGKDVDPVTMFSRMTNLKAGQLGNQPRTTTSRQINFTDPEVAKTWLREAFQSSMGRDPHDAEIRQMLGAIASGNKGDAQVMQTTTDANGNSTQQVLDPGFDPQAYIRNQMADDPEGAAYQAASTLYPALMQALASPT